MGRSAMLHAAMDGSAKINSSTGKNILQTPTKQATEKAILLQASSGSAIVRLDLTLKRAVVQANSLPISTSQKKDSFNSKGYR